MSQITQPSICVPSPILLFCFGCIYLDAKRVQKYIFHIIRKSLVPVRENM